MRKHGETKVLEKVHEKMEDSRNRPPRNPSKRDEDSDDSNEDSDCPVRNRIKQKCEFYLSLLCRIIFHFSNRVLQLFFSEITGSRKKI